MENLNAVLGDNLVYIFSVIGIMIAVMVGFMVNLERNLSAMKKRYKIITAGADGVDIQQILTEYAKQLNQTNEDHKKIQGDVARLGLAAKHALTKVAVVRFNAFHDDSAELSYCIALLDEENSGVIISSLNGRDFSRSYVKPIVKGESSKYKLTDEEKKALQQASSPSELQD